MAAADSISYIRVMAAADSMSYIRVMAAADSMSYIRVMAAEYDGCVEDLKKALEECDENKGSSCSL